jgi:hypothetical protein
VAHLLGDGLVETQRHTLMISTEEETRGQTSGVPLDDDAGGGIEVGMAIDRRRFVDTLIEAVAQFP